MMAPGLWNGHRGRNCPRLFSKPPSWLQVLFDFVAVCFFVMYSNRKLGCTDFPVHYGGWEEFVDDKGRKYYHNAAMNETVWEKPEVFQLQEERQACKVAELAATPGADRTIAWLKTIGVSLQPDQAARLKRDSKALTSLICLP
jgi:hypothetical protein